MSDFDDRVARLSPDQRALLVTWLEAEAEAETEASPDTGRLRAPFAAPGSAAERVLARVVATVLDVPEVGVDDDWFELGGDSVQAIVVVAHAEAAGLLVSTRDLFAARTVRRLAERAAAVPARAGRTAPVPDASATRPLTGLQEGMLFHALTGNRATYHVQLTCELHGDLDEDAFLRAWQAVVDAHAALRATFHLGVDGVPYRRIVDRVPTSILTADHRDAQDRPALLASHLTADLAAGFDLTAAPLLRLALFRTADSTRTFVLTHHHLLLDGWSLDLVLSDVLDAYRALRDGGAAQVPDRSDPPRLGSDSAHRSATGTRFWQRHLAGYTGAPGLRGLGSGHGRAVTTGELDDEATAAVLHRGRAGRFTALTVVLGACAVVLGRLTATADVLIGTTVSGRSTARGGLVDAVGMFITTLPARIRIVPTSDQDDWLRALQEQLVALAEHDGSAPADVARSVGLPAADLFDVVVVGENFPSGVQDAAVRAGLEVSTALTTLDEGIPIVLEVRVGDRIALRLGHDLDVLGGRGARSFVDAVVEVVGGLAAGRGGEVGELMTVVDRVFDRAIAAERSFLRHAATTRLAGSARTPFRAAE